MFFGTVGSIFFPVIFKYLFLFSENKGLQKIKSCLAGSAQALVCNDGYGTHEKKDAQVTENRMSMK